MPKQVAPALPVLPLLYALRWSAVLDTVAIVGVGVMGGVLGLSVQCSAASACEGKGLCEREEICSYVNVLTLSTSRVYLPVESQTWLETTRGMCAPGELLWPLSSELSCLPRYTYPDALQTEMFMEVPEGFTAQPHRRACGAWIDAVPPPDDDVVYHALARDEFAKEMAELEEASYSTSSFSADAVSKFYRMCASTMAAGPVAIHAAGKAAYNHLVQPTAFDTLVSVVSSGCLAPVEFQHTIKHGLLQLVARNGVTFPSSVLETALFFIDETDAVRTLAIKTNNMARTKDRASIVETGAAAKRILELALNQTDQTVEWEHDSRPIDELGHFLHLQHHGEEMALAYIKGVAAVCAVALSGQMEGSLDNVAMQEVTRDRPHGPSLGRLPDDGGYAPTRELNPEAIQESLRVNLGALQYKQEEDPCTTLTRFVFTNATEETRYDLVVPPALQARLNELVVEFKSSLIHVVSEHPILSQVYNSDAFVPLINAAHVMLPGAPAALPKDGPFQSAETEVDIDHSDGPLVVALKQTAVWWKHQINIGLSGNAQLLPNVFDSLAKNAYVYPSTGAIWLLLGILRRPFADASYDDVSLATRIGYIISHELGHLEVTLERNASIWDSLLGEYLPSTRTEAIADVLGTAAVIASGRATKEQVCLHVSQLWCARLPNGYDERNAASSHPAPNVRGDRLCRVLDALF